MKKQFPILILMVCMMSGMFPQNISSMINVVPKPNSIVEKSGSFTFKQGMTIAAPLHCGAASLLTSKLEHAAGIRLQTVSSSQKAAIIFSIDTIAVHSPEGYQMNIDANHVIIKAATETGLYYGVQTLLQLLPPQIESNQHVKTTWRVPCILISDAPQFAYRGFMLDVCRHFLPVENVKKLLDAAAMYKINRFHWHLTDDQGWRIEIKRYPKLTQIGSTRTEANGTKYGGYYTQDQIKEIVKYAAKLHIEVIPEIEMPGHSSAALAAYPQYSCTGSSLEVPTWFGVHETVYCPGNDSTYTFLSNILDEVCALFPSSYIHIGGDECPKNRWKACPKCQSLMKEEGLKTEEELQSYFTKRMEKILEKKGKRIIGWDEILEGGIAPSATVMSWRGEQGGIEAANAGHDVIMSPGEALYMDHYQGSPLCEPIKIGGFTTLQETYQYNPIPKAISSEMTHHVLGLQGNLWGEFLYTPDVYDYQLYPRVLAIAETGWTQPEQKDMDNFIKRLDDQQIRLDKHNIAYYIPMPEGNLNYMQFTDSLRLPFTTNRPVRIVYTVDGTTPTINSKTYREPILVTRTMTLKLRSVLPQGKMSAVRTIHLTKVNPMTPVTIENPQKGLRLQYTKQGYYQQTNQLQNAKKWENTVISNPNEFFSLVPSSYGHPQGAAIFTGYLYIAHAGIYQLHCEADKLIVNNKLLIANDGEIKRSVPTDITVPFKEGYYPVKMIVLNNVWGGCPSSVGNFSIQLAEWNGLDSSGKLSNAPLFYTK